MTAARSLRRRVPVLGVLLAIAAATAAAAPGELRPLSEDELSAVYGRGLSDAAVGALSLQQQSGAYASASSGDALAAMALLTSDGTRNLDRQLSQQQVQTATVGVGASIRMAQTLAAAAQVMAPVDTVLPTLPFPLLFMLPSLPSLAAINSKH